MKILFISDLNVCLEEEKLKEIYQNTNYDVIISLGNNLPYDFEILFKYKKPNVKVYGLLGTNNTFKDFDGFDVKNINGSVIPLRGKRVFGLEGGYLYKDADSPMYEDFQINRVLSKLPYVDLLCSHTGPTGFYDDSDPYLRGFKGLQVYVKKQKPKYHVFGHYEENKEFLTFDKTKSFCVYGISLFDFDTGKMTNLYEEEKGTDDDNL